MRIARSKWFLPSFSVALGLVFFAAQWIGGDLGLALASGADRHDAVPPPPAQPTSADQIQNVDQVKTAIKAYYGDTIDRPGVNPVDGAPLHTFSPTAPTPTSWPASSTTPRSTCGSRTAATIRRGSAQSGAVRRRRHDAEHLQLRDLHQLRLQLDLERAPSSNAAVFQAVPHMVDLEHYAESKGYTVFFLTGRGIARHAGTLTNLTARATTWSTPTCT